MNEQQNPLDAIPSAANLVEAANEVEKSLEPDAKWWAKAYEYIAQHLKKNQMSLARGKEIIIECPTFRDMGKFANYWNQSATKLAKGLRDKGYKAIVLDKRNGRHRLQISIQLAGGKVEVVKE